MSKKQYTIENTKEVKFLFVVYAVILRLLVLIHLRL